MAISRLQHGVTNGPLSCNGDSAIHAVFDSPMADAQTHPTSTPPPAQRLPEREEAAGYMLSSIDLRRGLDISAVAVNALPAEILRELTRLRRSWEAISPAV